MIFVATFIALLLCPQLKLATGQYYRAGANPHRATGPAGAPDAVGAATNNHDAGGGFDPQGHQEREVRSIASDELIVSMCDDYFSELDMCKKYVFVTGDGRDANFNYGTDLSSIEAVDAVCHETAELAGLPGLYHGWFSTSNSDAPSSRFSQAAVPYVRPDGIKFAEDWDDLIGGQVEAEYFTDEFGRDMTDEVEFDSNPIPTNTLSDGSFDYSRSGVTDCNKFSAVEPGPTHVSRSGIVGYDVDTNRLGTYTSTSSSFVSCALPVRFVCVQQ